MNDNQIKQLQEHIDRYFELDISEIISSNYPDVDKNMAVIGELSAKEFISLSNKVFHQFREELKGSYIKILPYQYQFHNELGGSDLNADLSQFISFLSSNRLPNALTNLKRLVHYQAINGFWEKAKRKYFRHSEEAVNNEKERIELVSKQLDKSVVSLETILSEIDSGKEDLSNFINSKKKELSEIESLLESVRMHASEVTELHTKSAATSEKINLISETSEERKYDIEQVYKEARSEVKKLKDSIELNQRTIQEQSFKFDEFNENFTKKLSFIESKTDYFMERNKYLDDLIGREVGASLFETFKQRKSELSGSINFWKYSVPLASIGAIAWTFFLFGNGDLSNLSWQVILINTLKAMPALGLLLFTISQYTKERNFQEEYAFKSAVALTINSYADQLQAEENKDKLIMDSVNTIYKTPISTRQIKIQEQKELLGVAKELSEVTKSMIDKK